MPAKKSVQETVKEREEVVLKFWEENKIFKKSEEGITYSFLGKIRNSTFRKKKFFFYDGPPFATGLPHYGHILASAVKDAIPRYKTMRGFVVKRQWGWDCHGLPLEVEIEKKIGSKTRKDIEAYGIENFNNEIRKIIFQYVDGWKKIIPRIGRWVDMENDYRTITTKYTESVWAVFNKIYKNGFVSHGRKSVHLCPRCSTVISNTEVVDSYETLTDTAVHILFPLKKDPNMVLVAWTTTPWTLFGNVALGVDKDIEYVVLEKDGKKYIVHKNATDTVEGGKKIGTKKGSDLIDEEYIPPFEYLYAKDSAEVKQKIWRIHHVEYIDVDVGTGIVHLAPAYGAEDMEVAQHLGLPIRHHVSKDGIFTEELREFAGLRPKEEGNPKDVENKIIEALRNQGALLSAELLEHSYPVCWRCNTPLLNYAADSWFINAEKFRDSMSRENKKVLWVPEHIRDGRFGKWLENAREWAISRSRYWGAPLPVWKVEKTGEHIHIGSLEEMFSKMRPKNTYTFVRHAYSINNEERVLNCKKEKNDGLTEKGKEEAKSCAEKLKDSNPTIIFCSPLTRTRETAEYIAEATGAKIIEDPLLVELQVETLHNKSIDILRQSAADSGAYDDIEVKIPGGESYLDVYNRVYKFFKKVDEEYSDANIIVVTHKINIAAAKTIVKSTTAIQKVYQEQFNSGIHNVSIHPLVYKHVQRTEYGEIDVHRPYIDTVVLYDDNGNPAYHIKEVFDCWFESGSMPYGSQHYPFENNSNFNPIKRKGFPADFVCEGLDQTRGWFYSLMAVGVGAFGKAPYKRVITTGIVRANNGKKMSKSLKNYPDPMEIVDTYGADTLRHYLLGSPITRGEDINFSDEQVSEIYKKVYTRLHNCLNFYSTYAHLSHKKGSKKLLDKYIMSRFAETHMKITKGFEEYQMCEAVAPIAQFVDDLSTWYVRRSRDRMRYDTLDGANARETLRYVLTEFSKCIAPIAPFYAEYLFLKMAKYHPIALFLPESVHLSEWPRKLPINRNVLLQTDRIRKIVSIAHEQRATADVKVRQPLAELVVREYVDNEGKEIIASEINVKTVTINSNAKEEVLLNTTLSPELLVEGFVREYIRNIQKLRKEKNFSLTETLDVVYVWSPKEQRKHLQQFEDKIKKETRIKDIVYDDSRVQKTDSFSIDGVVIDVHFSEESGKIFS